MVGGRGENMVRKFTKLIKTDSIIHFASKGREKYFTAANRMNESI
jgi:hypothetical protein